MGPWVLIYLGGAVNNNLLIVGSYATLDGAVAAAATTGAPYNYQPCQVYGPPVATPDSPYSPQTVIAGSFLAVTQGVSFDGGVLMYGYGGFNTMDAAVAWAQTQDNPSAFSFGQIFANP